MFQIEVSVEGQVNIFYEEIIIFEIKQNAQIQKQSGEQANPTGRGKFGKQKTQEKI